jgi:hypothetical protein
MANDEKETSSISYSWNEGVSWHSFQFTHLGAYVCVCGGGGGGGRVKKLRFDDHSLFVLAK